MPFPSAAAAADLIKHYEGFREKPYLCPGGRWTIGYGFTRTGGGEVHENTEEMKVAEADIQLEREISSLSTQINLLCLPAVPGYDELAALISFCYNLGIGNFKESTLLKKIKVGDDLGAVAEFPRWRNAGAPIKKVMPGLERRRASEVQLFQGQDWRLAADWQPPNLETK